MAKAEALAISRVVATNPVEAVRKAVEVVVEGVEASGAAAEAEATSAAVAEAVAEAAAEVAGEAAEVAREAAEEAVWRGQQWVHLGRQGWLAKGEQQGRRGQQLGCSRG